MTNPLNESTIEHHAIAPFKELGYAFPSEILVDCQGTLE